MGSKLQCASGQSISSSGARSSLDDEEHTVGVNSTPKGMHRVYPQPELLARSDLDKDAQDEIGASACQVPLQTLLRVKEH